MTEKQENIGGLMAEKVISGCCENSRQSQEALYRHFFPIMQRMVSRYTRDEDQLIDILNNGFLRVFKNINSYNYAGSFEGWIRKIMFHSVSNYFRSKKTDVKFLVFEDNPLVNETASSSLYFDDLMTFVKELPDKHQQVFHLYAIEGFKHKEIGAQLNISENTSKWYLSEARKLMQDKIGKRYASR